MTAAEAGEVNEAKGDQAMKKMTKTTKTSKRSPAYKVIVNHLGQLTLDEARELDTTLHSLIEALEDEAQIDQTRDLESSLTSPRKAAARSHIELKTINGCGPYKYLRFWEGKTLRSVYKGKA